MKKRTVKIIICVLLLMALIGGCVKLYSITKEIYDENFNYRCATNWSEWYRPSQFETLTRERHTFESKQGQQLVGYLYEQSDPNLEKKGVVVFAHGLGAGGQTGYMDIFNYLTMNGYYVFAYDATGNDESEGDVIGGLPQGVIDLDHAIDYAYTIDEISDLPFVLMGYSWGAFSVTNVLNYHPEVKVCIYFCIKRI